MKNAKLFVILIASIFMLSGCGEEKNYDLFAKCLDESGLVMYGSVLCPHCMNVKEEFGNAFRYIEFIECNANMPGAQPEHCQNESVQYLPTFKFGDGTKLFGEVEFSILATKTGCVLP